MPRRPFDAAFAFVLLAVGAWLLLRPQDEHPEFHQQSSGTQRQLVDRTGISYRYRVRLLQGALFGILIGFVSSFLGIGGGIFQVPLMIGYLGFPTGIATATSELDLTILAAVGTREPSRDTPRPSSHF